MAKGFLKNSIIRYPSDKILLALVLAQALFWCGITSFWQGSRNILPDMTIVPEVPGELDVKATSFGDEQFYFRTLALQIQNAGDTFGRFTSLLQYDYAKLEQWFYLLDSLDHTSNFVPSLASYIFGQTLKEEDIHYIVNYLDKHASGDLEHKWWWMAQAVYLANHKMHDKQRALELAYKLASTPAQNVPIWVRQMPAFILEDLGEKEDALRIIYGISQDLDKLSPGEINFMNDFIQKRLGYMQETIEKLNKEGIKHP